MIGCCASLVCLLAAMVFPCRWLVVSYFILSCLSFTLVVGVVLLALEVVVVVWLVARYLGPYSMVLSCYTAFTICCLSRPFPSLSS